MGYPQPTKIAMAVRWALLFPHLTLEQIGVE